MNRPDFFNFTNGKPVASTDDRRDMRRQEEESCPPTVEEAQERLKAHVKVLQNAIHICCAMGSEPHLELYSEDHGGLTPLIIIKVKGFTKRY